MSKTAAVIVIIIVAILIIGYLIFMFISFKHQKWIFQPHQSKPPKNSCYPQIQTTPLTQADQDNLKANLSVVSNQPKPVPTNSP